MQAKFRMELTMEENLIEIAKNFKYLLRTTDYYNLDIDLNNIVGDIFDKRIDKFIKFTLATYPYYFDFVEEKKESNVKISIKNNDLRLKKKFLKEIKFNISIAADTLLEKNILNDHNDVIIRDINYMTNKSSSKLNLQDYIKADLSFFLPGIEINVHELSKYLRDEIILRIKDNNQEYNIDAEKELNLFKNQEKEFLYEQLWNAIQNGESAEEFWNNY